MAPFWTALLLLAPLFVGSVNAVARLNCPSTKPPGQSEADEARFASLVSGIHARNLVMGKRQSTNVSIPVTWHVITRDNSVRGGNMPDSYITDSIRIMNRHYASTGFRFELADITRQNNRNWFDQVGYGTAAERQMKSRLRVGGPEHLNVYTVGFTSVEKLLGYAAFPDEYEAHPETDGVVMLHTTVAGGTSEGYNLGGTLSHEVGHWLGLFHTFEGGCTGRGDYVDDTPAEVDDEDDSCNPKDSCPNQPGRDLIGNFMTYAFDTCYTHFTPGQVERMRNQWAAFRAK